jgi:hypothetical protein
VGSVANPSSDALLGMLHPAWQAVIAGLLLIVTILGIRRLVARGPTRMTNGVFVTGALILAITLVGTLAVSCSGPQQTSSEMRSPGR